MSKPNLLFVTTEVPFPANSGGTNKSLHLLKHLSKNYNVHFVGLSKTADYSNTRAFEDLLDLTTAKVFLFERQRSLRSFIQSVFFAPTLNVFRNDCRELKNYVQKKSSEVDIIFVDHLEMMNAVPRRFDGDVILHEHNAEYLLWQRLAKLERGLKSFALYFEAQRVYRYEMVSCMRAKVVFAAPNDVEALKVRKPFKHLYPTYHLGKEELLELPELKFSLTEKRIFYLGTLSWEANVTGLLWFFKNIWPSIKERVPGVLFDLVGGNIDARVAAVIEDDNQVVYHGFLEDPEPIRKKCRIAVVPQLFGSGLKVKIVDAAYRGLPVITTKIGAEGWGFEVDKEILISDDPDDFADKTVALLLEESLWQQVSKASRERARRDFRWEDEYVRIDKGMASL